MAFHYYSLLLFDTTPCSLPSMTARIVGIRDGGDCGDGMYE